MTIKNDNKQSLSFLRSDFPALNKPGIYLDNAATTHKPQQVIDALMQVYQHENAPVHRGLYAEAEALTARYESVRQQVADWIGAQAHEIVFTSGATDGINLVAQAWAMATLQQGDEIVITELEHHANSLPWYEVAARVGAIVKVLPIRLTDCQPDIEQLDRVVTSRTRLVAMTLYSNVIGPVQHEALTAVAAAAQAVGARLLLDASQVPAHRPLNVSLYKPDFLVFSGHKMFGPTGVGVAYISERVHSQLRPYRFGGGMVVDARHGSFEWQPMPALLEAGTPPIAAVIGLGAAISYLQKKVDYEVVSAVESQLTQLWWDALAQIDGVRFLGVRELVTQGSIVTCAVEGIHAHDIAALLAEKGIAVRAGHHCCQPLHTRLGLVSSLRMSVALYTTGDEVKAAAEAFAEAARWLRVK